MIMTMRISNCSVVCCYIYETHEDIIVLSSYMYLHYVIIFMCVFFRLLKIRCEKSKFQASSTSTKHVFQNVLDEMNKCAPKNIGMSPVM